MLFVDVRQCPGAERSDCGPDPQILTQARPRQKAPLPAGPHARGTAGQSARWMPFPSAFLGPAGSGLSWGTLCH